MKLLRRTFLSQALAAAAWPASTPWAWAAGRPVAGNHLAAYGSEAELRAALERWQRRSSEQAPRRRAEAGMAQDSTALGALAAPAPLAEVAKAKTEARDERADSITNVQTAGVDEGGIVKRAGEYLIVLRRGRLFTVRVGGDQLAPVAALAAYAPGLDPAGAWYDELLVSGRDVVVVGYSYARGGTEIGLFELGADGTLRHRATHHLRSFDYYSSRNYASRLIGRRLVFYSPTLLSPWAAQPWGQFPAARHWHGETGHEGFTRILPATRVFRTDDEFEPGEPLALHTITSCELGQDELRFESTAVLGPAGRVFYVSQGSVYVWTSRWPRRQSGVRPGTWPPQPQRPQPQSLSAVFRIPLDGREPSALKTAGVPIDQMSFLEDDGHLSVLLKDAGRGEGMWGGDAPGRALALLRVPLAAFGSGHEAAQREHYRDLPTPAAGVSQNRFVGAWLLWGGRAAGGAPNAWALRVDRDGSAQPFAPGHDIERIEALGRDAVLVGSRDNDLHFSALRLARGGAALAGRHVQPGVAQGETRTHGFFYRAQDDETGLLGLPVLGPGRQQRGFIHHGRTSAAAVLFLRNRGLRFSAAGELVAHEGGARDDGCKASCVAWYGNARPIFLGDRVLALMGYEIVEGAVQPGPWRYDGDAAARAPEQLVERRRISFAPEALVGGRYSPFN